MLLVIDTGNTQTVVGLYDDAVDAVGASSADEGLVDHWRIATNSERTEDELALVVGDFLGLHGLGFDGDISGIAVCSGVPSVSFALRRMAEKYFGLDAVMLGPGVRSGLSILYDDPRAVGADRIANAVGAVDLFGGPAIVVDFGTATTFDVINREEAYLGGAILPGVEISLEALYERAALLRQVELEDPGTAIGRSTAQSIQSGVVYGFAELVEGMVVRIRREIGDATVIATGGLAGLIAPHAPTVQHHEPWLTLHGLRIVYEKNAS